ncbi:MAG: SPFH domain-containing protein [Phycisphaerae bacterium]
MTETSHARSRRAALMGLLLTVLGLTLCLVLAQVAKSVSAFEMGWFILGGLPIWFASLLVFRQHELAAMEQLDLEELRREKQATGGGEAIFGQEGAPLAGYVAEARLKWMERYLVPAFALVCGAYLVTMGLLQFWALPTDAAREFAALQHVELSLILLAILTLLTFLLSRYSAGMGRVAEWGMLRAGGSYLMGVTILALALCICLGAVLYRNILGWERVLAYVIPLLMVVIGGETLLNFVLDIYRPRTPGAIPRAAFDSRLLGLFSEPGGIAHSLAEAVNYQFGFRVSQTWFYLLLQRTFVPLVGVGALALWLMSSLVIVNPFERAIIEQWGRQLNADAPLGPGIHFKWPAPIQRAYKFNTGELHRISIGYKTDALPAPSALTQRTVELWTDETHAGREHFKFVIAPPPRDARPEAPPTTQEAVAAAGKTVAPVNTFMMEVVVQFKIDPDRLAEHTRSVEQPEDALRSIAWHEVVRFNAAAYGDALLGDLRKTAGEDLRKRIAARCAEMKLGYDIVYVDLVNVHPEKTVAEAYRGVINARQEKIAEIRKAQVTETEVLSKVAGSRELALVVADALEQINPNEVLKNQTEQKLSEARGVAQPDQAALDALGPLFMARTEAAWAVSRAADAAAGLAEDFELGIAGTARQIEQAEQAVQEAQARESEAVAKLEAGLTPLRRSLSGRATTEVVDAWVRNAEARFALQFWYGVLEKQLPRLEGDAAVALAEAQANRWQAEMQAAAELARLHNEREAFRAAPAVFRARHTLAAIVEGVKAARKYFLAFDATGRSVKVRYEAQTVARPGLLDMPTKLPQ